MKESDCCSCGKVGEPLHYVTSCPFTASFHITKPTQDLETIWRNKVMKTKLSRIKTRNLVKFLLDNESLLSPDPDSEQGQLISRNLYLSSPINTEHKSTQSIYGLNTFFSQAVQKVSKYVILTYLVLLFTVLLLSPATFL
ncbi:hypothetical protein AVEN_186523-1 [Araneus ventricosus]|uniref:Uncharacterized protein n=1 Tax=Araneus ventricosus TaxID=182803 RepID=A0A4Y2PEE9_ARAVE|nr:hypothetical protein AVEN_237510-1 [Araneus ventricosus]GBN48396.1 hypothetical protein AVEN_186523-1 [Araneus ventricosus]